MFTLINQIKEYRSSSRQVLSCDYEQCFEPMRNISGKWKIWIIPAQYKRD